MKKQTFVQQVMAAIKGGDEAKVARFAKRLEKYYAKQISSREDKIEELREKLADQQDALNELIKNVNMDRISNSEHIDSYVVDYHNSLVKAYTTIDTTGEEIETLEEEIAQLKAIQNTVFGEEEA